MIAPLFLKLTEYPAFRRIIWKPVYETIAKKIKAPHWQFMNYGYVPFAFEKTLWLQKEDKFADALFLKKTLLTTKSITIMKSFGKTDGDNHYGYGIKKAFISRGINYGYGHKGRDVGYTANLFYFPEKKVTHIFFINYGTDSKSNLRQVFYDFQEELLNLTLQ